MGAVVKASDKSIMLYGIIGATRRRFMRASFGIFKLARSLKGESQYRVTHRGYVIFKTHDRDVTGAG